VIGLSKLSIAKTLHHRILSRHNRGKIASAQVAHYARNGKKWGVSTSGVSVDLIVLVGVHPVLMHVPPR
jgi:hypothetical protein